MIKEEYLKELDKSLTEDTESFNSLVNKVVSEQSLDLDSLMEDLREAITQKEAASTDTLERYYAELSNMVYFMCSKIECLNVYSDLSRAKAKEAYNKAYLDYSKDKDEKGKSVRTVNENTALAENDSQNEYVLNTVYDHAYKTLKMKVDMAMEMITTLKNIMKRRVQEDYVSYQMNTLKQDIEEDDKEKNF